MYLCIICLPQLKFNLHKNPCLSSSQHVPNTRSTTPCALPWPRPRVSALTPFATFRWFSLFPSQNSQLLCSTGRQTILLSSLPCNCHCPCWASQVAQWVKDPPAMQETQVRSLGQKDPLEEGMAVHSSILAWRISWTEESGGLHSMGWQSWTRLKRLSTNAQSLLKTSPVHRLRCHLAYLPSLPVMIPGDSHSHIKVSGLLAHRLVYCPSPVFLLNHLLPFIFTYNVTLSLLTLHSPACAYLVPYPA